LAVFVPQHFSQQFLPINRALYLLIITGVRLLNLVKKSLLLSCGIFLFGCASTDLVIERKNYHSWESDIGYSQVVRANNTLYISGITSEEATFENQLDDIYNTIKKILADYNVGTSAIVKEVIFTTDIEKLKASIPSRKAHFSGKYPSSSWVEVKRLWSKSHLLEVEVVVVLP
jgi:2-iminobutanoate/2-iminopropanoate deaminase